SLQLTGPGAPMQAADPRPLAGRKSNTTVTTDMPMTFPRFAGLAAGLAAIALAGCHSPSPTAPDKAVAATQANGDRERLLNAAREPGQWMMDGRNYTAQRYSPLKQINEQNASQLGLAWFAELDTFRGVEATPLVVDGVLYDISAWNITYAFDA